MYERSEGSFDIRDWKYETQILRFGGIRISKFKTQIVQSKYKVGHNKYKNDNIF